MPALVPVEGQEAAAPLGDRPAVEQGGTTGALEGRIQLGTGEGCDLHQVELVFEDGEPAYDMMVRLVRQGRQELGALSAPGSSLLFVDCCDEPDGVLVFGSYDAEPVAVPLQTVCGLDSTASRLEVQRRSTPVVAPNGCLYLAEEQGRDGEDFVCYPIETVRLFGFWVPQELALRLIFERLRSHNRRVPAFLVDEGALTMEYDHPENGRTEVAIESTGL